MKISTLMSAALLAAAGVITPASAATLQYTLSGLDLDGTVEFAKFRLDSNPTVLPNNVGQGFRLKYVPGIFQYGATVLTLQDIQFFDADLLGGFMVFDSTVQPGDDPAPILITDGPQLFSGSPATPTLLTGDFALFDSYSGAPLSLNVTAVPEPASWALLISGFGVVGVAMRRRGAVRAAVA